MDIIFSEIELHLNDPKKQKIDTHVNGICTVCHKPFTVSFYNIFRKKDFSEICHKCKLSESKIIERWADVQINNQEDIDVLIERIDSCKNPTAWKTTNAFFTCEKCGKRSGVQLKSFIKNKSLICSACKAIETNEMKYGYKNSFSNPAVQSKAHESLINKYGRVGLACQEIKDKATETNVKKYGAPNPLSLNTEPYKKRNETVQKKYNVSNVFQDEQVKEKCKKAWINNYGVDNPSKSEKVLDRIEKTNLKSIGVSWPMQSPTVQDKLKATNLEKFGSEYVMGTDYFKEKSKQTYFEKHGVTSPLQNPDVKKRIKMSNLEKYGVEWFSQTPEFATLRSTKFMYDSKSFDSSWELAFYIYCIDNNKTITRPTKKFAYDYNGTTHYYHPDFEVDGKLYEIKGPQFFKKDGTMQNPYNHELDGLFEAKHQCGLKNDVIFITNEDIKKYFNYVNSTYTKDFINLFKKNIPFPYPNVELKDKSDFGIIQHFHKSIYHANRHGKRCPYDAWLDKDLVLKSALNRLRYKKRCKPSDILQGFNIAKIAPKVSVFNPKLAEQLINRYIPNVDIIFDPFSGFSGRMLGAFNCGKQYFGFDINEDHVRESNEIIEYKKIGDMCSVELKDLLSSKTKDYTYLRGTALFTCPPYNNKEQWGCNEQYKNCDEWIDLCIEKYKVDKYLFVVDKTEKYSDKIVEVIHNKSHFGCNDELILLI